MKHKLLSVIYIAVFLLSPVVVKSIKVIQVSSHWSLETKKHNRQAFQVGKLFLVYYIAESKDSIMDRYLFENPTHLSGKTFYLKTKNRFYKLGQFIDISDSASYLYNSALYLNDLHVPRNIKPALGNQLCVRHNKKYKFVGYVDRSDSTHIRIAWLTKHHNSIIDKIVSISLNSPFENIKFEANQITKTQEKGKADWLVMIYMNPYATQKTRNNKMKLDVNFLVSSLINFLNHQIKEKKTKSIIFAILMKDENKKGQRIIIRPNSKNLCIETVSYSNGFDIGSGEALSKFVAYAKKNFNVSRKALFIHSHGTAWSGICHDRDTTHEITMVEFAQIFKDYPLEIFHPLACYMGNIEAAYQIRNVVDYYVASQPIAWGDSRTLLSCVKKFYNESDQPVSQIAIYLSDIIGLNTIGDSKDACAVIDLSYMEILTQKIQKFAKYLSEFKTLSQIDFANNYQLKPINSLSGTGYNNNVDLLQAFKIITEQMKKDKQIVKVKQEFFEEVVLSMNKTIIFFRKGNHAPLCNGFSICFLLTDKNINKYLETDFAKRVNNWSNLIISN